MMTQSVETYLLAIYRLTEVQPWAKSSHIAAAVKVQMPSVSEMLKRLETSGYVVRSGRKGAKLTSAGRQLAINQLRKHCLLTTFLVVMADYQLDEVHEEAARLEHAISDRLADSLEKLLNHPKADPFGHPIPAADRSLAVVSYIPLSEVAAGETVIVRSIDGEGTEMIHYLRVWGLVPGAQVQVADVYPLQGPITVVVAGAERPISYELAQKIRIEFSR